MTQSPDQLPGVPGTGVLLAGRYRLTARIGRGGTADVFEARDELLHRAVAVKLFRVDSPAGADRRRVQAEARTLASLRHPGLVAVYDAGTLGGEDDGTPFLVMELVRGPALLKRLADGPLSDVQAALAGAEVAGTLGYVHSLGIVHRDVKPANILLDEPTAARSTFAAKLTDFGIARLLDSTRMTMEGMTIGTANYLSPEQAEAGPVGAASDLYSLGLVLIECLTGQVAFPGVGVEAALARLHRQPQVPREFGPAWAGRLTALTARDPNSRPTALQAASRLRVLAGQPADAGLAGVPGIDRGDLEAASTQLLTPVRTGVSAFAPQSHVPAPDGPADRTYVVPSYAVAPGEDARHNATDSARARRRVSPWLYFAAGIVALIGIGIVLVSGSLNSGGGSAPPPSYPTVPGQLGQDLQRLQETVR